MTDAEIRAIRERAERCDPSPWEAKYIECFGWVVSPPFNRNEYDSMPDSYFTNCTNADFIAHARTDVPALCDAVEEARKELRELADLMRKHGAFTEASEKAIRHALGGE
jgi:hypothetical protein